MEDAEPEVPADPLAAIQDAIAEAMGEPNALLAGFAVVAEWVEEDGEMSTSILHTAMTPWHLYGLMTFGREWSAAARSIPPADLS